MGTSSISFDDINAKINAALPDAVKAGAELILDDAKRRAPKDDGDLIEQTRISVTEDIAGTTAAMEWLSPYARKEHEHLYYHHVHGGEPKFQETAQIAKGSDAVHVVIGDALREAIS